MTDMFRRASASPAHAVQTASREPTKMIEATGFVYFQSGELETLSGPSVLAPPM
jgi:hypothetical protein